LTQWYRITPLGLELFVYVQPGASKTSISGVHDGCLKLRIQAPPVEGQANQAVIAFLANCCDVPKNKVRLLSGDTSRKKRLLLEGLAALPAALAHIDIGA
jgi:uncharacterized protein (TIGR00251 family)